MKQKNTIDNLVTKDFLEERLEVTINALIFEMDKRHDKVMTALDGIVKELEIAREDRDLALSSDLEMKKQLLNHEKRLKKLETTTS